MIFFFLVATHIAATHAEIVTHFLQQGLCECFILHCAKIINKQRLAQLKEARLASVTHFKKWKLERISNTEQPRINDNELNTNNTGDAGDASNMGDTNADTNEEGT